MQSGKDDRISVSGIYRKYRNRYLCESAKNINSTRKPKVKCKCTRKKIVLLLTVTERLFKLRTLDIIIGTSRIQKKKKINKKKHG